MGAVLVWWLVVQLIGLLALPLTYRLFKGLPDRGFAFARPLGLLLAEDEAKLAEAAEHLKQAAELMPENARVWYNLGLALQKLKRYEEGATALKRSARSLKRASSTSKSSSPRWPSTICISAGLITFAARLVNIIERLAR